MVSSAAEIVAICAISALPLTSFASALMASTTAAPPFSRPRLSSIGLAPAAMLRRPSCTIACARTTDVVVPSPAVSLVLVAASLRSCAPMFSNGSSSSTSRATVTPSWVTVGEPNFLSSATLRPFGPSVVFTALAMTSTPCFSFFRASSVNTSCFAIDSLSLFVDAREDVLLRQDQVLLTIELEFGPGVLLVEDALALFELDGNALAVVVTVAWADREDAAFHRLLFRCVGKEDPTLSGLIAIEGLDDHAGSERLELDLLCDCWHEFPPSLRPRRCPAGAFVWISTRPGGLLTL